jgi:hypothetical protein
VTWIRNTILCFTATLAAGAFADTGASSPASVDLASRSKSIADSSLLPVPKVGIRVGIGNWNEMMVDAGMDVTFKVPIIPLPAIRVDGEIWGKPGGFGQDRHGNALSVLGVQNFIAGYAGFGLSYFYTDNEGDHQSGFGFKAFGGMNLPHSVYVEAGIILGPKLPPIMFTIGQRF